MVPEGLKVRKSTQEEHDELVEWVREKRDRAAQLEDSEKKASYWYGRAHKYKVKLARAVARENQLILKVRDLEARLGLENSDEESDRFAGI
jgi:hypothetical protein